VDPSLPNCKREWLPNDPDLPKYPDIEVSPTSLTGFLDAANGTDLRKRQSITGYCFMMSGGCVSYQCKTQSLTATSSTELEFYAAVSAAKQAKYLPSILTN